MLVYPRVRPIKNPTKRAFSDDFPRVFPSWAISTQRPKPWLMGLTCWIVWIGLRMLSIHQVLMGFIHTYVYIYIYILVQDTQISIRHENHMMCLYTHNAYIHINVNECIVYIYIYTMCIYVYIHTTCIYIYPDLRNPYFLSGLPLNPGSCHFGTLNPGSSFKTPGFPNIQGQNQMPIHNGWLQDT